MTAAVAVAALALAFANGANDNFKGVATLHGSGRLPYRWALALATVSTLMGSLAALAIATGLVRRFSGRGLVPEHTVAAPEFVLAVAVGAGATVWLATRLGIPISTTHALTGGLVGAGLVLAGPDRVAFGALATAFLAPLAASPLLALGLAAALRPPARRLQHWTEASSHACVCATPGAPQPVPAIGVLRGGAVVPGLRLGAGEDCRRHGARPLLILAPAAVVDGLHVLSAGAVGFARGLNDTPKIAGLLATAALLAPEHAVLGLAFAMAAGGIVAARRVARTLAFGITGMSGAEGLAANLVTAGLVVVASPLGVPVSTTHVSCGALFGIGAANGEARWRMVGAIASAWTVTLPVAAAVAGLLAAALRALG